MPDKHTGTQGNKQAEYQEVDGKPALKSSVYEIMSSFVGALQILSHLTSYILMNYCFLFWGQSPPISYGTQCRGRSPCYLLQD